MASFSNSNFVIKQKMKTFFFSLALMASSSIAIAQIPNAGFETWSNTSGFNTPEGWDNLNSMTASSNVYTCTKGTPGSTGSAYLKLVSKAVTGMGVMPGIAVSGMLDMATMKPMSGFPYNARPTSLTGKWQYMATGADQGYIAIYLTRWDAGMGMRDTIGKAKKLLPGMAMSWATFTLPVVYSSQDFPDSCQIVFSASGNTPVATSYLYIDGLSFTGVVTANKEVETRSAFKVWPSPVTDKLNFDAQSLQGKATQIRVLNLAGQSIEQVTIPAEGIGSVDMRQYGKGVYFLEIQTADKRYVERFVK
jgi:hypothetical protein